MTQTAPFIVIEGLDGAGTTTQSRRLVESLRARGVAARHTAEPTAGPFGAALRLHLHGRLVASRDDRSVEPLNEYVTALAFAADRMDHVQTVIEPSVRSGVAVVSDRYYLSSLAYQSVTTDYEWVRALNRHARVPDITVFLSVPVEVGLRRKAAAGGHADVYERADVLGAVNESYLRAVERLRAEGETIHVVDADRPEVDVQAAIGALVEPLLVP